MPWLACALLGGSALVLAPCARAVDLAPAPRDTLTLLSPETREPLLSLTAGAEFEGERQVFGFSSLFDTGGGEEALEVDSTRYRERAAEMRALLGLAGETAPDGAWFASGSLDARLGATRRSLQASTELRRDASALRGLRLRHLLSLDDQEEDDDSEALRSLQSLLQLHWNPGGAGDGHGLVLRAAHDLSRASAEEAGGDSVLATYADYLDYDRFSLGVGWASSGLSASALHLDLSRREAAETTTSYTAAALTWTRSRWTAAGGLDLEARLERRRYDEEDSGGDSLAPVSSALPSYDEAEILARSTRGLGFGELRAELRLQGQRYADPGEAAAADSLLPIGLSDSFSADRLRCELEGLLRRELLGAWGRATDSDLLGEAEPVPARRGAREIESLEVGAGLCADLLWVDGEEGSWRGGGLKLECRGRSGPALGEAWWDLSAELGRRAYTGDQDDLVFEIGGDTFSLAQSDFTYGRLALVGGGRLPLALQWEISAFLDREMHEEAEDDIDLFTVRLALLRRWNLIS